MKRVLELLLLGSTATSLQPPAAFVGHRRQPLLPGRPSRPPPSSSSPRRWRSAGSRPDHFLLHLLSSDDSGGEGVGRDDALDPECGSVNFYDDFEGVELSSASSGAPPPQPVSAAASPLVDDEDDPSFLSSLRRRKEQLRESSRELLERWQTGSAKTFAAFTINESLYERRQQEEDQELPFDWVRRVDIGSYPRVACGSAHGSVFVADVESRRILGVARGVHSSHHNSGVDALDEKLRHQLYGEYDGGGVLAVAMSGANNDLVASSGREGGVKLFKLIGGRDEGANLQYLGDVPSLKRPLPGVTPVIVTCLKFDLTGRLFVGGQDGLLRMVTFPRDLNGAGSLQATVISSTMRPQSPILSLDVSDELEMVATAHANGDVRVYSMNREGDTGDGDGHRLLGMWNPFTDANDACHARSVAFAHGDSGDSEEGDNESWGLVVGGGNGQLWIQRIHPSRAPEICSVDDDDYNCTPLFEDIAERIKPDHRGPVVSLATRTGGVLVSASHDGMLRMTRLFPAPAKALYGLGGYKVWIGSVCVDADGKRLLSDGRDDVLVVHDFSEDQEEGSAL